MSEKLEEVEELEVLATPSLPSPFFHGTQPFPVARASRREGRPDLVYGAPITRAESLARTEIGARDWLLAIAKPGSVC